MKSDMGKRVTMLQNGNRKRNIEIRVKQQYASCEKKSNSSCYPVRSKLLSTKLYWVLLIAILYRSENDYCPVILYGSAFAPIVTMLVKEPATAMLKDANNNIGDDGSRNGRHDRKNGGRGFGNANSKGNNSRKGGSGMTRSGSPNMDDTKTASDRLNTNNNNVELHFARELEQMQQRITQLENIVSSQQVMIRKLTEQCKELAETSATFTNFLEILQNSTTKDDNSEAKQFLADATNKNKNSDTDQEVDDDEEDDEFDFEDDEKVVSRRQRHERSNTVFEASFEDTNIFGTAPETVLEAADAAGASILAGILAGKQRMLVDVRDAELQQSEETFVQFLELAVLPVAAGLEGLRGPRNRLKIVFPTVSDLLQYRKSMCLSAPEVVTLSTLGFDPVEDQDNMVVLIAPAPDDDDGLAKMNELLQIPTSSSVAEYDEYGRRINKGITKPVVVLNRHMVPITGPAAKFEVAYHLRLLSVQYVAGGPDFVPPLPLDTSSTGGSTTTDNNNIDDDDLAFSASLLEGQEILNGLSSFDQDPIEDSGIDENSFPLMNRTLTSSEKAFEDVLKHAHEQFGRATYGVTRAMVIRAYPHSWNVFVDTSPDDSSADFEVAAVFDTEPSTSEIHQAIVSCLEGSEQEDEVVAQQMQQAYEAGQLDRVSDILAKVFQDDDDDEVDPTKLEENDNELHDDDEDDDLPYQPLFPRNNDE